MNNGAILLKQGRRIDPEDHRMSYRLGLARDMLGGGMVLPTTSHDEAGHRVFNCCGDSCKTTWPEWMTDEMFEMAYNLANLIQSERSSFTRRITR